MSKTGVCTLLLITVFAIRPGFAQVATGSVDGEVTNMDGAAISGVTVTVTGVDQHVEYSAVSDARGVFALQIPLGRYKIVTTKPGFTNGRRPAFNLDYQNETLNFHIRLAEWSPATQDTARHQPSPYSYSIRLPGAIKADSEIPLEVMTTNTSDEIVSVGFICGLRNWMFKLDVRDAEGHPVEETPAAQALSDITSVTCSSMWPMDPGQTVSSQILLNSFFDLSRPGEYTVQASGGDASSSVLKFRVRSSHPATKSDKPSFTVSITTPFDTIKTGWQIPLKIAIKNLSSHDVTFANWEGRRDHRQMGPDEFGLGMEIRDSRGNPVPLTPRGLNLLNGDELIDGDFAFVTIAPGEVLERIKTIGQIFNIGHSGSYSIQLALEDPITHVLVRSNKLNVTVNDSAAAHPPFIIAVDPERGFAGDRVYDFRVCQTNISDRTITLNSRRYNGEILVKDSRDVEVPLNEQGKKWWQFPGNPTGIRPGDVSCAYRNLIQDWNVTQSSKYSLHVVVPDYPAKTGEEAVDSNIAIVTSRLSRPPEK